MVKLRVRLKKLGRVVVTYGVAGLMLVSLLGAVPETGATEFPTWDEIRAARGNEAATADKVAEVEGLLQDLREQAGAVGDKAVQAESTHHAARAALESNQRRLLLLQEKHDNAVQKSEKLRHLAGGIAAQTYKTGSTSPGVLLLLDADQAIEAANRLAMTNIVGGRTKALYAEAEASANLAEALEDQQKAGLAVIEEQTQEAARALRGAESADHRARLSVARQQEVSSLLVEQLAELKGTTTQLEGSRIRGLSARESYQEQQEAAREAPRNSGPSERGTDDGSQPASLPAPGSPAPVPVPAPEMPVPEKSSTPIPPAAPKPPAPSPSPPSPVPSVPAPPPPTPIPAPPPVQQPEPGIVDNPAAAQAYANSRIAAFGWNSGEFRCLVNLWNRESGWRTSIQNPYSGAYGIPQALPGSKMASAGADWRTNYRTQIEWGLGYVSGRYGSPCGAWEHSEIHGWY